MHQRNFIALNEMNNGEDAERRVAMKLLVIFEITSIAYDQDRQLPKVNSVSRAIENSTTTRERCILLHHTTLDFN